MSTDASPPPAVRRVPIVNGWRWIVGGWRLFLRKPLTWIVFTGVMWAIVAVSGLHWILASLVAILLPVFLAGWARACAAAERGESIPVTMLFDGFRRQARDLVSIGSFNAVANVLVLLIVFAIGGDTLAKLMSDPAAAGAHPEEVAEALPQIMRALLVGMFFGVPVAMSVWFAPFSIALDQRKPLAALLASLRGMVINTLPMFVYGLVFAGVGYALYHLFAQMMKPPDAFALAVWLMMPVLVPSVYVSYRDIFGGETGG